MYKAICNKCKKESAPYVDHGITPHGWTSFNITVYCSVPNRQGSQKRLLCTDCADDILENKEQKDTVYVLIDEIIEIITNEIKECL